MPLPDAFEAARAEAERLLDEQNAHRVDVEYSAKRRGYELLAFTPTARIEMFFPSTDQSSGGAS